MKKKTAATSGTAAEFVAALERDAEHVRANAIAASNRDAIEAELHRAEMPLRQDLEQVGVAVTSVWDLVNSASPYVAALPVLVRHLRAPYPPRLREGIARALAVPEAGFAWGELMQRWRDEEDFGAKTGLAAALAASASEREIDAIVEAALDAGNGDTRALLVTALGRIDTPEAQEALSKLALDTFLSRAVVGQSRRGVPGPT